MLNAGHCSDMHLVTGQLLAQDARDSAFSGWFGLAPLQEIASTASTLLALSLALGSEEALGRGLLWRL